MHNSYMSYHVTPLIKSRNKTENKILSRDKELSKNVNNFLFTMIPWSL